MAITHELKTPIAVSRLNLETMQKHQLEEDKRKKLLQATLQETLRLDTLINNILISSQLEGNAYSISKEELDFSELTKDVIKAFCSRYPDRRILVAINEDVELEGDAVLLKLLLSNLLENANKYSPKEKDITLQLSKEGAKVVLQISDEGCGIPEEEKKVVFQKFYRVGNEQTRKTQGTGLGLYICKRLAKEHNGDILIRDNQPTGSKFIVQFYRS
jgi:signal transduction histidine kinase